MQNEKLQINLSENQNELIIREVDYINELSILAPLKLDIKGTIDSVSEFIKKRISEKDQINEKRCHIFVNRYEMSIKLVINENDNYLEGKVFGKLELHQKFNEFGINSKKEWEPAELGQFLKMNRAFFIDKSENMSIVSLLKNFKAKIDTTVEKQKIENGSFNEVFSGIVTSNLPGAFKLNIPLFKGKNKEEIEIEIYASINGRNVSLQLFSPGANQAIEEIKDSIIDSEIDKIVSIAPNIAIFEQ